MTHPDIAAIALSPEERKAITSLRRLAKRWPDTLWLFSGAGAVAVMRRREDGEKAMTETGAFDPAYIVATVDIPNDGGDW